MRKTKKKRKRRAKRRADFMRPIGTAVGLGLTFDALGKSPKLIKSFGAIA